MKFLSAVAIILMSYNTFAGELGSLELDYPNDRARQIGEALLPKSKLIEPLNVERTNPALAPQKMGNPGLNPMLRLEMDRIDNERERQTVVLPQEEQRRPQILRLQGPRVKEEPILFIIVPTTQRYDNPELSRAVDDVLTFINNYDQAIERLELTILFDAAQETISTDLLRTHAMADASLRFFKSEETIAAYEAAVLNEITSKLSTIEEQKADEISEIKAHLLGELENGHFPMEFLGSLQ